MSFDDIVTEFKPKTIRKSPKSTKKVDLEDLEDLEDSKKVLKSNKKVDLEDLEDVEDSKKSESVKKVTTTRKSPKATKKVDLEDLEDVEDSKKSESVKKVTTTRKSPKATKKVDLEDVEDSKKSESVKKVTTTRKSPKASKKVDIEDMEDVEDSKKSESVKKVSKSGKNKKEDEDVQLDDLAVKYQKKTIIEHIKDIPDTYIGSISVEHGNVWTLANLDDENHIINKEVEYVPGLRSIIEEILVNAFDNMNRVNQKNAIEKKRLRKVTYIKVWTNRTTGQIVIENDGEGIDVALHPTENIYIPQMIFGEILTSGNYNKNEEKITGGKNGYGAKLTNIYSTYFKVETVDRIRKLKYTQEYKNNMDIKKEPIIESYKDTPFTRITFIPDYARFKLSGMSEELEKMIKKRTIDMFVCSREQLRVFHNDSEIRMKIFTDYMQYYLEPDYLTVSCSPNDRWEIGACMSPNFTFQQVSFVNGICTHRGGKHVDYIVKQITKKLVDFINKKKRVDVKESYIRDNLMVFVNATIVNPSFDSQTKETLSTLPKNFGSECIVPDSFIEKLAESGILDKALSLSEFRDSQMLKKTDGVKKKRLLDIPKLDDAHFAGTKKASQCTLILTEGDSAKAMAVAGISVLPDGHDYYGIFPLRGKMVNTRDKEDIDIANNKEICNIKKILALQEDVEYKDTSALRYGRIMLMTDSDVDGSHIKGLLINFLSKWQSLMKIEGFITSLLTPIVKVWKKSNTKGKLNAKNFYTLSAYNEWLESNNVKGYEIKYYKGLGSSTPQEGKEYFKDFKLVTYFWDDQAAANIDMAFCKERADDRKMWLADYDMNCILDINQSRVTISDFVNKDLIHFSNYDNHRSIPSIFDGLKPSLRKIIYCAFKRNLRSEIKVVQLAGYVSEHGAYHHGETSLNGAIINLAQNYVGTNNINLLVPEGQFGCLAPDTEIILWNGDIKLAQDVIQGDILIGDDGCSRTVLKITSGIDNMYEIKDAYDNHFTVNSQHILTLHYPDNFVVKWQEYSGIRNSGKWYFNYFDGSQILTYTYTTVNKEQGYDIITKIRNNLFEKYNYSHNSNDTYNIIDIKVTDYLKLLEFPNNIKQHKLYMISNHKCINWPTRSTIYDPYHYGSNLLFTNLDIVSTYLVNDKDTRLQLLAGVIDMHGYINNNSIHLTFGKEHLQIVNILKSISRSLGYATTCTDNNDTITLQIIGNLQQIPLRILSLNTQCNMNEIHYTKFTVKHIGKSRFCGWSIDGNERFLLGNYIVTHNSRLTGGDDAAAPRYIFTQLSKITHILFNKDDQPLLKSCEDDGQIVEPLFYMPILPIILINGTTGIGTGWSSNIPQFNPTDIVTNIRNLMKGVEQEPLTPWYRGFTGTIRKISLNKWMTKGRYRVLDESTVEISELPIGSWTQNFKELLDIYEKGYKPDTTSNTSKRANTSKNTKKPKWVDFADSEGRLIKSYKNECSESTIKFTVKFDQKVLNKLVSGPDKTGLSEFEKLFQLSSSLSCGNTMNLYDENNKLKHFNSPEAILQYYYEKRLHYYELRRQHLIHNLEQELLLLSTRARFILDVIADKVVVRNTPESEIIKKLKLLKYSMMVDNVIKEFSKLSASDIENGNYDFLITMAIRSMTKEKVEELLKEQEKRTNELEILKNKTDKDLWEEDLKIFESEYKKHMSEYYDSMGFDASKYDIKKTVPKIISKKPKF